MTLDDNEAVIVGHLIQGLSTEYVIDQLELLSSQLNIPTRIVKLEFARTVEKFIDFMNQIIEEKTND